jgi:hypothetical protein
MYKFYSVQVRFLKCDVFKEHYAHMQVLSAQMRPLPLLTLTTDDETSIMQQTSPRRSAGTSSSLDQEN